MLIFLKEQLCIQVAQRLQNKDIHVAKILFQVSTWADLMNTFPLWPKFKSKIKNNLLCTSYKNVYLIYLVSK
jgi:hypothetical protein